MKKLLMILLLMGMLISAGGCDSNIGMLLSGQQSWDEFTTNFKLLTGDLEFGRKWYVERHPYLDDVVRNCILNGEIRMGMTVNEVQASWGKPYDINRTVGSWGTYEQWVYLNNQYLYFEDGILTSWQN